MKLGANASAYPAVVAALEEAAGLPRGNHGQRDTAWLNQVLERLNQAEGTEIKFAGEDWGYSFSYSTPDAAVLLGKIKEHNQL